MAKVRQYAPIVCARTSPQFYRVRDKSVPADLPPEWITRSRGRATCPQDGSSIVTLRRDGQTIHLCITCLGNEAPSIPAQAVEPRSECVDLLRCRGPRRVLA